MKKTLLVVTLTLVLAGLTGCSSKPTEVDNSEVLAVLESMQGNMERMETKIDNIQPTVSSKETPSEQPAETEETQEQTVAEQPAETGETQEEAPAEHTKLQVSVIHCKNRIPVKLVEGKLSEDCISNPTDLDAPTGSHRDLYLLFVGEKIQKLSWIYGDSQERTCELSPTTGEDGISYLCFNMEEGNGIYLFEVVTETGKVYSFSVKYYSSDVI